MTEFDLHTAETAAWRALITEAQLVARVQLPAVLEDYVTCMLVRQVGTPPQAESAESAARFLAGWCDEHGIVADDLRIVGDHCLTYAGLFPEHAIGRGLPLTYFVEAGRNAYLEYATVSDSRIYADLGSAFVNIMDVLQTMTELHNGAPCLDPLSAYQLWRDAGSSHAWRVLQALTPALPARDANSVRH